MIRGTTLILISNTAGGAVVAVNGNKLRAVITATMISRPR
jgi:hypothetical protein